MEPRFAAFSPFEVVLYPNPPLGRYAFVAVIAGVAAVSFVLGLAFALAGAWPVTGFLGLDLLLLGWAMQKVRRDGRQFEVIRLDKEGLRVRKVSASGGTREWLLEPYWARVEVEPRGPASARLAIRSHGNSLRLGSFLTMEECRRLADELNRALADYRP